MRAILSAERQETLQSDVRALTRAGLPPRAAAAVAPLRPGILGIAVGVLMAAALALVTGAHLLVLPQEPWHLHLLSAYFPGYRVSFAGLLIGSVWAFAVGFVAGWLLAFARNGAVRLWLEIIRLKANLSRSTFLDDI